MKLNLHIWRQSSAGNAGGFVDYTLSDVSPEMSFLEMLDVLNERLIEGAQEPVAFDHDCREGICGMCGMVVNGTPHGPRKATTTCQLHMREFNEGDDIWVEPFRADALPVVKDLVVDRGAFDRIIQAGGFISVRTGSAPEANSVPVPKADADAAFEAAACIGCAACVAACPNASAMLFTSAKVSHLGHVPQGQPERYRRVLNMVEQMDSEGFGNCSNHRECEAACPKEISFDNIARMNRDLLTAAVTEKA